MEETEMDEQSLAARVARQAAAMRDDRLILYAGASLMPESRSQLMAPELSSMPVMGRADHKEQPGADFVCGLESELAETACQLFSANWAEVRLPSCTLANLAVYAHFTSHGQTVLGPADADGGHLSQRAGGTPSIVGLDVVSLSYDSATQRLDEAKSAALIHKHRPALVILGRSVIIRPDEIANVVATAHSFGALVVYDASHVLGLIAGGAFPNPFDSGVDLVTSSTYKTLYGPTGGIVLGSPKVDGFEFSRFIDRTFLANQNAARLPAILDAMRTFQRKPEIAGRIIDCASELKKALIAAGVKTLLDDLPALTHQVVVPIGDQSQARAAMQILERANLYVGTCSVPGSSAGYGLRFGSQILARMPRVCARNISTLGHSIADVLLVLLADGALLANNDASIKRLRGIVSELMVAR